MSTTVNIISLIEAKKYLTSMAFSSFKKHHCVEIKDAEIDDVSVLCEALLAEGLEIDQFGSFHVGYKIPQIGKEFDLLRFDEHGIVNIEVKRLSNTDSILKQLKRNRYYLSFTNKQIQSFVFVASTGDVYTLDAADQIILSSVKDIASAIVNVSAIHNGDIDHLFDPSDYLVSPFNSTEKFLRGAYFLTGHQEEIVKSIAKKINNGQSFSSISGGPGTGKSLLVYDLAKTALSNGHKVLVIHCGNLNSGQEALNLNGFTIVPVKKTESHKDEKYDLIIVDEAQRIRKAQFQVIVEKSKSDKIPCVFSHDERQTLAQSESITGVSKRLKSATNVENYELSEKIRSNAEISDFIKLFINRKRKKRFTGGKNITISYFYNKDYAIRYWSSLSPEIWKRLRLTPSQHDNEHHEKFYGGEGETSHNVIGQEFDGVAIMIDDMFGYDDLGDLIYKKRSYYDPVKMIFQNITRTRKRLNIVIVNNEEILNHCTEVLSD